MRRLIFLCLWLAACTPQLPNPANLTPVTAMPTMDSSSRDTLCAAAQLRGQDWEHTIEALQILLTNDMTCEGTASLQTQLYTAYLAHGTQLENEGRGDVAKAIYETALQLNPAAQEAQERLLRMQGSTFTPTEIPPEPCEVQAVDLPPYTPTEGAFVRLGVTSFLLEGQPYPVYGANYFPRDTPFRLFMTETNVEAVTPELELMRESGLNTLRVFLYNADLFACPYANAIPIAPNFERFDSFIHAAAAHGFRLIVVLNHEPDVMRYPLYSNPEHIQQQTRLIVERYHDEPAILAWDVRDRGDFDYRQGDFRREQVLAWVSETVILIRTLDTNHTVTAGWWQDAAATAPLVDFVSFQFYGEYQELRQEIANLRAAVNKPILLSAIGYSTFAIDEIAQRNLLFQAFEEVSHNQLLGWVVYMAFDYPRTATCTPPDCPGNGSVIDHYGIWNTSYFRKLAVDAIEIMTGVQE